MAWEYPTNFSNGTSASSVAGMFEYANYVTGNFFAHGVLTVIWCIVFFSTLSTSGIRAVVAASFITMIFSIYFSALGIVSVGITITIILVFVVSAVFAYFEKQSSPI